jgi:hypothetical protein
MTFLQRFFKPTAPDVLTLVLSLEKAAMSYC